MRYKKRFTGNKVVNQHLPLINNFLFQKQYLPGTTVKVDDLLAYPFLLNIVHV